MYVRHFTQHSIRHWAHPLSGAPIDYINCLCHIFIASFDFSFRLHRVEGNRTKNKFFSDNLMTIF